MPKLRPLAPKNDTLPVRLAGKSVTKRSRHQYNDARWEAMKPTIVQLFIHQRKTAGQVVDILRVNSTDPFVTSRRQLFVKLKEWDLRKNGKKPNAPMTTSVQAEPSSYLDSMFLSPTDLFDGHFTSQFASGSNWPLPTWEKPESMQWSVTYHLDHWSCGATWNDSDTTLADKELGIPDPDSKRQFCTSDDFDRWPMLIVTKLRQAVERFIKNTLDEVVENLKRRLVEAVTPLLFKRLNAMRSEPKTVAGEIPPQEQDPALWPPMLSRPSTPMTQWEPDTSPPGDIFSVEECTSDGELCGGTPFFFLFNNCGFLFLGSRMGNLFTWYNNRL